MSIIFRIQFYQFELKNTSKNFVFLIENVRKTTGVVKVNAKIKFIIVIKLQLEIWLLIQFRICMKLAKVAQTQRQH